MLKYQLLKTAMTTIAILFPPAVLFVPALSVLKRTPFTWILYIIYVLIVLFVWGIGSGRNQDVTKGFTPEDNKELEDTKRIILNRSRWHL